MNKSTKALLGVFIAVITIFVMFKLFIPMSLKHFGGTSEEALLVMDYIAIYVPILIAFITLIVLLVSALNSKKDDSSK